MERRGDGYSRALQAARVRASYQRAYFAPALFNLIPVKTDLIASMAVDSRWRLYYNDAWLAAHTVEENAAVLIHEVSHLLREHEARKQAAAVEGRARSGTPPPTARSTTISRRGTAAARRSAAARQVRTEHRRERRDLLPPAAASRASGRSKHASIDGQQTSQHRLHDCGSGAHGERRPWELPDDDGEPGRRAGRRSSQSGARAARRRAAHPGSLGRCRRRPARLAPMGAHRPDAEGGLHGHHPPRRAQGAARQHARPIRPHVQPAASPAGVLRRVHHVVVSPAAAQARVSDRHLQLDAGHAAGESGRRAGRADASARLRHRGRRRLLRRGRARREERCSPPRRWSCTAAAARTSAPACAGSPSARAARSISSSSSPTARRRGRRRRRRFR